MIWGSSKEILEEKEDIGEGVIMLYFSFFFFLKKMKKKKSWVSKTLLNISVQYDFLSKAKTPCCSSRHSFKQRDSSTANNKSEY